MSGYHYREVICPWCSHRFMWQEGSDTPPIYEYREKTTERILYSAKCPVCEKKMIVLPGEIFAVSLDDDKVKTIPIRGI